MNVDGFRRAPPRAGEGSGHVEASGRVWVVYQAVHTFALEGLRPVRVRVEASIRRGTPSLGIVGLAPTSAHACRERIRAATAALGLKLPGLRITVNLAPSGLPKRGASFDLPVVVAVLAAAGEIPADRLGGAALLGELGLDGGLLSVRGALAVALACAADAEVRVLVLPVANGAEAAAASGVRVVPAAGLTDVLSFLSGRGAAPRPRPVAAAPPAADPPDLADVRGQEGAKRALEVAAAGGHHLLLVGEPGAGKTLLARRLPGLLPDLSQADALDVSVIHSVAGLLPADGRLVRRPPFRAPHHTATEAGLVGGGVPPRPGEVSLAHRGVLFLDELAEFRGRTLDALRAPMEEGVVRLVRSRAITSFPARFQLVGATNPCPCGFHGSASGRCTCAAWDVRRYFGRISGPLLDRFDLRVAVPAVDWRALRRKAWPGRAPESPAARERVSEARALARARARTSRGARGAGAGEDDLNAGIPAREIDRVCRLDAAGERILEQAAARHGLTGRGCHRVLRVARTVADLEGSSRIRPEHVAEALLYRGASTVPG